VPNPPTPHNQPCHPLAVTCKECFRPFSFVAAVVIRLGVLVRFKLHFPRCPAQKKSRGPLPVVFFFFFFFHPHSSIPLFSTSRCFFLCILDCIPCLSFGIGKFMIFFFNLYQIPPHRTVFFFTKIDYSPLSTHFVLAVYFTPPLLWACVFFFLSFPIFILISFLYGEFGSYFPWDVSRRPPLVLFVPPLVLVFYTIVFPQFPISDHFVLFLQHTAWL